MSATPGKRASGPSSATISSTRCPAQQRLSGYVARPFHERTAPERVRPNGAEARPELQGIRVAIAFAFNLPPIIGLGTTGGFEYQLQDLGGRDTADMADVMRA